MNSARSLFYNILRILFYLSFPIAIISRPTHIIKENINSIVVGTYKNEEYLNILPLAKRISAKYNLNSRLLVSILIIEVNSRNSFVRSIENNIFRAEIILANLIPDYQPTNFSYGLCQLKLNTAVWIDSDFGNPRMVDKYLLSTPRDSYLNLLDDSTNIELTAKYLKYLVNRRTRNNSPRVTHKILFIAVASEFNSGMKSVEDYPNSYYGEIAYSIMACHIIW